MPRCWLLAHNLVAARDRVAVGGLFCVRVNAVGTDIALAHEVIERDRSGGFTVRYLQGPKSDLVIHFFGADELEELIGDGFAPVVPIAVHQTWRPSAAAGQWSRWEGIWRRLDPA